jgi:hypothetical protein
MCRRYVVANGLTVMVSLTFAPHPKTGLRPHQDVEGDREWVMEQGYRFVRNLRRLLGRNFPALWVVEPHEDGHWHLHVLLPGFVRKSVLERAWWGAESPTNGFGWVDVRRIRSGRSDGPTAVREDARIAAVYASKYVGKQLEAGEGAHAYEVTQGFQPKEVFAVAGSFAEAREIGQRFFGVRQVVVAKWDSDEVKGWHGPVVRWWCWGSEEPAPRRSGAGGGAPQG